MCGVLQSTLLTCYSLMYEGVGSNSVVYDSVMRDSVEWYYTTV